MKMELRTVFAHKIQEWKLGKHPLLIIVKTGGVNEFFLLEGRIPVLKLYRSPRLIRM